MVMGFCFAFDLVDNFVYLQGFVIGIYYYMMLKFVSKGKLVLVIVFVHFVYLVQKDLVDK